MKKFFRKLYNLFRRDRRMFKKGDIITFPEMKEMQLHPLLVGDYSISAKHTHKVLVWKTKTFTTLGIRFNLKYLVRETVTEDVHLPVQTFRRELLTPVSRKDAEKLMHMSNADRIEQLKDRKISVSSYVNGKPIFKIL